MQRLSYCVREAAVSLWRQRGSSALSMLTIAVAMLVLGGFLTVAHDLNRAVSTWSAAAEFTVYLRDDITQDQRMALNRVLGESRLAASRTYVSKAEALRRFKRDFPDLAGTAAALAGNPMPASIEVRLHPGLAEGTAVEALATRVGVLEGVADVRFDRRWLARLGSIAAAIRLSGWILGGILVLAAVLTVSTVVRLSLHRRRDEVEIMQLMGAPVGLLRGPLVAEGILHGGVGAVVAVAVLYGGLGLVQARVDVALPGLATAATLGSLPPSTALWLVAGGMVVGCLGGLAASRHVG